MYILLIWCTYASTCMVCVCNYPSTCRFGKFFKLSLLNVYVVRNINISVAMFYITLTFTSTIKHCEMHCLTIKHISHVISPAYVISDMQTGQIKH